MPRFGPLAVLAVATIALAAGCRGNAGAAVPPPTGLVKGNPLIGPDGTWLQAQSNAAGAKEAAPCASPAASPAPTAAQASATPAPTPTPNERKEVLAASPAPSPTATPTPCQ